MTSSQQTGNTNQTSSSKLLKLIQELQRDYDLLAPGQVRSRLSHLGQVESEEMQARKTKTENTICGKQDEERLNFKYQVEKMKVNFEYEMSKVEKNYKDKTQDAVKTLKIRQLDKLIIIVSRLRQIQTRSKNNEFTNFYEVA